MEDSAQLLRNYAETGSEAAFAELVNRHISLVYSTAARRVNGNGDLARDITQMVFCDLARKAGRISGTVNVSGWLNTHANFVAANALRGEHRRLAREQEAALMQTMNDSPTTSAIEPLLDDALQSLPSTDREAVILRYFEGLDLRTVGMALGTSEDAAQKRIARSIERLRGYFAKRGVAVSATAMATALATSSASSVPAGLAGGIVSFACATAIPTTTILLTLVMSKAKTAMIAAIIGAAIVTPVLVQQQTIKKLRDDNQRLRIQVAEQPTAPAVQTEPKVDASALELAKLRAEVTQLRATTQQVANARRAVNASRTDTPPTPRYVFVSKDYIPSDTWSDAGLDTPEATLQTIGWAIRTGAIDKFRNTIVVTDGLRKVLTDLMTNAPPEMRAEVEKRGWGVEEAILMPAMAQDRKDTYKAFKIVSEEVTGDNEVVFQTEIETLSGKTHKQTMHLKRIGDEWKQIYDSPDFAFGKK